MFQSSNIIGEKWKEKCLSVIDKFNVRSYL